MPSVITYYRTVGSIGRALSRSMRAEESGNHEQDARWCLIARALADRYNNQFRSMRNDYVSR